MGLPEVRWKERFGQRSAIGAGLVFAGQRDDGFYADIASIFDLERA